MKFLEIINKKKFIIISIFLFLYVILNLVDGQRGLISYYEKEKLYNELINEKKVIVDKLRTVEKKNNLLTDVIDLDYLEILYRKNFAVGKKNEKLFTINR